MERVSDCRFVMASVPDGRPAAFVAGVPANVSVSVYVPLESLRETSIGPVVRRVVAFQPT